MNNGESWAKMATLEQTIIEKTRKLDGAQQQKILQFIEAVVQNEEFYFDAWLEKARDFRARMRAKYGKSQYFGVQTMLDEIREEADSKHR